MYSYSNYRLIAFVRLGLCALLASASLAFAQKSTFADAAGVAAGGADVVAYFTMNKPVAGDAQFSEQHNGATYRFASAGNLALFKSDPNKYAPQYGGYCAFAAAFGKKVSSDPGQWAVVDGKLYLNKNADVSTKWKADIPGFVAKADGQWAQIKHN